MSFILDALRKSENDRQRQAPPRLADAPIHRANQKRNIWIPLVSVLLLANLAVLIFFWTGMKDEPVQQQPVPAVPAADVALPAVPAVPAVPAESALTDLPATSPAAPVAAQTRDTIRPLDEELSLPPPATAPAATEQTAEIKSSPDAGLPTYAELTFSGALKLSPLHLDVYVYSDKSASRFAFINTVKHREGSALTEGPVVQEITEDGVILEYQGQRFLLTRE